MRIRDKVKVFNIIYAIAITTLFSGMVVSLYNLTFAYSTTAPTEVHLFSVTNILCIVMAGLTIISIILNALMNDKLFWVDIICASVSIVVIIVFMALSKRDLTISAFQLVWFELISGFLY